MEVEGEKPSSLPSNYVTIHQLKERWLQQQQQQQQQSSSKPEPENPKPKPNTQNQRPNYGRVTKEHKPTDVKVDDIGTTSKTLVVNEMKNPNKNDATKHYQRPNYRPVINQPKPKVGDYGSTSKTLVAEDLKNLKIKPMADDDGSSTKALVVVGVTDNLLNGENETGVSNSNPNPKKKKKKNRHGRRNPNVVTDQNPTRAEQEPGAKVVEEKMDKRSHLSDKDSEVEMVQGKGKERRRYGRGNGKGDLRFGAEPERKVELEQEAEVVEEKMEKKSCPTDKTPEVEMVEGKGKEWRRYGRRNGNSRFGAEPERKMELEQEAEVVEEKMEEKSYGRRKPADKNLNGSELKPKMEEELVVEKGKWGHRYGRRNGNSKVVWEQKERTKLVDGNGGGGGDDDGVVEEVVKERNVGQGRDINGGYGNGNSRFGAEPERKMEPEQEAEVVEEKMEKSYPTDKTTEVEMVEGKGIEGGRYGRGNGKGISRFGAEPEQKMEPQQEAEVVEEKKEKTSYGRRKPSDKNPNGAELQPEMEEEVVERGRWGCRYGRRTRNSRVVWEQKEKTAPVDGNGGCGGGDGVVEEVVNEMNVGQGRDKDGDYGRDKNEDYGRDRKGGHGRYRNGGYGRDKKGVYGGFQKSVPRGSFGEQKGQIWVKKGESVVPN